MGNMRKTVIAALFAAASAIGFVATAPASADSHQSQIDQTTAPVVDRAFVDGAADNVFAAGKGKPEGSPCKYTSECEQRPGMRCARPRGAPSKTPTRCMLKGY